MISGRFAISVHILTLLCQKSGELLSSDFIAGSININPVLVRKEIVQLKKAGYVSSKEGKKGGVSLAVNPSKINMGDVFKTVYQDSVLSFAKNTPNPNCPIGKDINQHLNGLFIKAEQAMLDSLSQLTLLQFSNQFN